MLSPRIQSYLVVAIFAAPYLANAQERSPRNDAEWIVSQTHKIEKFISTGRVDLNTFWSEQTRNMSCKHASEGHIKCTSADTDNSPIKQIEYRAQDHFLAGHRPYYTTLTFREGVSTPTDYLARTTFSLWNADSYPPSGHRPNPCHFTLEFAHSADAKIKVGVYLEPKQLGVCDSSIKQLHFTFRTH